MTHYQSPGRNQRPRGLRLKQALQFTLILAICIWLLYQIKPSDTEKKKKNNVESTWNKLRKESKLLVLGRKGGDSGLKGANFVGEKDTKHLRHAEAEKKDVTVESSVDSRNIAAHDEAEKVGNYLVLDKDKVVKDNHTDEVTTEQDSSSMHGMKVNETIDGDKETEDEAHSFNDENGVPQDLENDYQKINFYRSSISSSGSRSKISKTKEIRGDVESKLDNFVSENENDGMDTKNDVKAEVDSSSSDIMQVKSKDPDASRTRSTR